MDHMPHTRALPTVSTVLRSQIWWKWYVKPWEHPAVLPSNNKKVRHLFLELSINESTWWWSVVQTLQWLCVRLQPENTEDESRGTTQACTAKSCERSLRSGLTGVVKFGEFSSQIPLPQTTGRDEPQCRGTICNVFKVWTKAFLKSTSYFLRNSLFSLNVHVPRNYECLYTYDS